MKKFSLMLVTLFMSVLVSCSGGIDIEKCEKIAQKDANSITTEDLEFIVDQYENLYNDFSKASDKEVWIGKHNKDMSDMGAAFTTVSLKYASIDKAIPSSIEKKMEKISDKFADELFGSMKGSNNNGNDSILEEVDFEEVDFVEEVEAEIDSTEVSEFVFAE